MMMKNSDGAFDNELQPPSTVIVDEPVPVLFTPDGRGIYRQIGFHVNMHMPEDPEPVEEIALVYDIADVVGKTITQAFLKDDHIGLRFSDNSMAILRVAEPCFPRDGFRIVICDDVVDVADLWRLDYISREQLKAFWAEERKQRDADYETYLELKKRFEK